LPMNKKNRKAHLDSLKGEERTMVFYEAPHKLSATLSDLCDAFGAERPVSLCRELSKLHEEVRRTTLGEAVRWYETSLQRYPEAADAKYPLAEMYRDGSAGYCDVQRAIALFCELQAYTEVALMFDTGVTGPDGQVSLAPNAIIAEAFHAWALDPGNTVAGARLGDLFRDGSIVTANPGIAASFYRQASESQYCREQLEALVENGKVE